MKIVLNRRRLLLAGGFLLAASNAAISGEEEHEDHERALRALEQGEAKPLAEILDAVKKQIGGDVVGVDFERDGDHYVYELKIVTPDGRLREVYVDAMTTQIISGADGAN